MKIEFWTIYKTRELKNDYFDILDKGSLTRPYGINRAEGFEALMFVEARESETERVILIDSSNLFNTKESAESFYIKELEKRISIDQEEIRLAKQRLLK
jgi:hypothetical protein